MKKTRNLIYKVSGCIKNELLILLILNLSENENIIRTLTWGKLDFDAM